MVSEADHICEALLNDFEMSRIAKVQLSQLQAKPPTSKESLAGERAAREYCTTLLDWHKKYNFKKGGCQDPKYTCIEWTQKVESTLKYVDVSIPKDWSEQKRSGFVMGVSRNSAPIIKIRRSKVAYLKQIQKGLKNQASPKWGLYAQYYEPYRSRTQRAKDFFSATGQAVKTAVNIASKFV